MAAFLIVDEDRNFRDALAIALRLDGHQAATTGDADEARRLFAACGFECLVVDAHLAGADALLALAASSGARSIAVGPYPELLAAAARRHPRIEILPKPFPAADLVRAVGQSASAP